MSNYTEVINLNLEDSLITYQSSNIDTRKGTISKMKSLFESNLPLSGNFLLDFIEWNSFDLNGSGTNGVTKFTFNSNAAHQLLFINSQSLNTNSLELNYPSANNSVNNQIIQVINDPTGITPVADLIISHIVPFGFEIKGGPSTLERTLSGGPGILTMKLDLPNKTWYRIG